MSATELRKAAEKMRSLASHEDIAPGPWDYGDVVMWMCDGGMITRQDLANAAYITAMNPLIGVVVANWLEYLSDHADACDGRSYLYALKVAQLVNDSSAKYLKEIDA